MDTTVVKLREKEINKDNKLINITEVLLSHILEYLNPCQLFEPIYSTCKFFYCLKTTNNLFCNNCCVFNQYSKFKKILNITEEKYCITHTTLTSRAYQTLKNGYKTFIKNKKNNNNNYSRRSDNWINIHFETKEETIKFYDQFYHCNKIIIKRANRNSGLRYDHCCSGNGIYLKLNL